MEVGDRRSEVGAIKSTEVGGEMSELKRMDEGLLEVGESEVSGSVKSGHETENSPAFRRSRSLTGSKERDKSQKEIKPKRTKRKGFRVIWRNPGRRWMAVREGQSPVR